MLVWRFTKHRARVRIGSTRILAFEQGGFEAVLRQLMNSGSARSRFSDGLASGSLKVSTRTR